MRASLIALRLMAAFLVTAALLLSSAQGWAAIPRRIYLTGLERLEQGEYEGARKAFEECIRRETKSGVFVVSKARLENYLPHLYLADVLLRLGQIEAAAKEFAEAARQGVAEEKAPDDFLRVKTALESGSTETGNPETASAHAVTATPSPPAVTGSPHAGPTPAATPAPVPTAVPEAVLPAPQIKGEAERISRDGEVFFEWEPVKDAAAYLVEISASSDFSDARQKIQRRPLFMDPESLEPGEMRFYRVRARDSSGQEGKASASLEFRRPLEALSRPIRWNAGKRTAVAGSTLRISWEALPGVDGYDVEVRSGPTVVFWNHTETNALEFDVPSADFEVKVTPTLGGEDGVPARTRWTVTSRLDAPQPTYDPAAGSLSWPPVQGATTYSLRYGLGSDPPDIFFDRVKTCEAESCRLVLRGQLDEGSYTFGVRALDDRGGTSPEATVRVFISDLRAEDLAWLERIRNMILVDQDYETALPLLARKRKELDSSAEFHLLVGIGCYLAAEIEDPIPEEFGGDSRKAVAEHFSRAREIDPNLQFPMKEMGALKELVAAFEKAGNP